MAIDKEAAKYRALPKIERRTLTVILGDPDGIVPRLAEVESSVGDLRIDEERTSLEQANPELAGMVDNMVDSLHRVMDGATTNDASVRLGRESSLSLQRQIAYTNIFALLKVIDMQLRKDSLGKGDDGAPRTRRNR